MQDIEKAALNESIRLHEQKINKKQPEEGKYAQKLHLQVIFVMKISSLLHVYKRDQKQPRTTSFLLFVSYVTWFVTQLSLDVSERLHPPGTNKTI